MKVKQLLMRLDEPQFKELEVFYAYAEHSRDLRHVEQSSMCRSARGLWVRCHMEKCSRYKVEGILLS